MFSLQEKPMETGMVCCQRNVSEMSSRSWLASLAFIRVITLELSSLLRVTVSLVDEELILNVMTIPHGPVWQGLVIDDYFVA